MAGEAISVRAFGWGTLHLACGVSIGCLSSCASVTVTPITYQGQPKNETAGIRYYMPKPYLLVTRIPAELKITNEAPTAGPAPSRFGSAGPADELQPAARPSASSATTETKASAQAQPSQTSPSSTSDMSYQLGNSTYLLKLVYLPDMSKAMVINLVPGIFGTSSLQPTLQNGWMLTSMQTSADNTKAIDDLTTLATAFIGGAKPAATASTTKSTLKAAEAPRTQPSPEENDILPPGLYEFQYDSEGYLIGLCKVAQFKNGGVTNTRTCPSLQALASLNWVRSKY